MDMMDLSTIGQVDISTVPFLLVGDDNPRMSRAPTSSHTAISRERLRMRIEQLGLTPRKVSLAIGANQGYVRDLLDPEKTGVPSEARARALAEALETTTDWLFGRVESSLQPLSEVSFSEKRADWRETKGQKLPIYGTGYCADLRLACDDSYVDIEQTLFDPTQTVGLIDRPPALRSSEHSYAIYFHGSSMEPRFYQGEIGIVTPTPPPGPGDFVVVQLNDGNGDDVIHVLVKRLVRTSSSFVELEQFNPPLIFKVDRRRVTRMHKILGPNQIYLT
jgi:transcriptional regulator with XRE-family HTH domain